MELYKEILAKALQDTEVQVTFPQLSITAESIIENKCYGMLNKIRDILRDSSLSDPECFRQIEEIVCLFEREIDTGCGTRHDF